MTKQSRIHVLILQVIILIICIGCYSQRVADEKSSEEESISYLDIRAQIIKGQVQKTHTLRRADSLINKLFESEYTLCHFHPRYDKSHDYSKMHNDILDEIVFISTHSLEYERYIYRKFLRHYNRAGPEATKWRNCLMLIPKFDCGDTDYDLRLNSIAWIVKDTISIESSQFMLSRVSSILSEPCAITLEKMQIDYLWRIRLFESLKNQIGAYHQINEDFDYELYEVMLNLKDSLTTRFAYDYLMNNTDLPWGIEDILEDRFMDWEDGEGYTRYLGPTIILTEAEVKDLIVRVEQIEKETNCEWCGKFIFRMNLRFQQ